MDNIYTYDEALEGALEYFNGNEMPAKVWVDKYAYRETDETFFERTPRDMHRRLAKEFARIEAKYENPLTEDEIFSYLDEYKWIIPQGSPMSAIGNKQQIQSASNCFVIESPHDSYGGILKTDQELVQLAKRRAGIGFDISNIRPKGVPTKNAAKTTDGISVFMERYSNSTREVAQAGRRGALLLSVSVHHPEILTFATIKNDDVKVTGANISIRLTDEFMQAVKDEKEYQLRWPVDSKEPEISEWVNAKDVWDKIVESAHLRAEPGLLFWDTAKKYTPSDLYEEYGFGSTSTNPCGEIVLSPYDSCRLLVVNLKSFVKNPFTDKAKFDYKKYAEVVRVGQRLMDDLVDLELEMIDKILKKIKSDPESAEVKAIELNLWKKIKKQCSTGRRTGLGIVALGDALANLNVKYGSEESIKVTEKIYKTLAVNSYTESINLAKERGSFDVWDYKREQDHPFLSRIFKELDDETLATYKKYGRRNIANTTTAPTGSLATQTETTSGIESAIFLEYTRRRKVNPLDPKVRVDFVDKIGDSWMEYDVYHKGVEEWMEITGETDISKSPYYGATANEIDWHNKIRMQGAAQKWICHAISNTTNLPEDISKEVVSDIYMTGWETGCKGVTVYREGSRSGVIISKEAKKAATDTIVDNHAPKRPNELPAAVYTFMNKGEKYVGVLGLMENRPYELFTGKAEALGLIGSVEFGTIKKNKTDGESRYDFIYKDGHNNTHTIRALSDCFSPEYYNYAKLVSSILRHGMPLEHVVNIVDGLSLDQGLNTWSSGIKRVLKKHIKDGTKAAESKCESCGDLDGLVFVEGCTSCKSCGYSRCG